MEILVRGIFEEVKWRGTCYFCKTIAVAKLAELQIATGDYRSEGPFGRAACPVCKKEGMVFYPQK